MLKRLDLRGVPNAELAARLPRPDLATDEPVAAVRAVLAEVRQGGDAAVRRLTERFDGVDVADPRVTASALDQARQAADPQFVAALVESAESIEAFHRTQLRDPHRHERLGITVEAFGVAVARAGCYVPGGRASYPSSVLMTAVPARVAGVDQVVLCVPPDRDTGQVAAATLVAASVAGVDEVYAIGGAQAIGAMAYGTESVAPVDVIVGPGNLYVALAKREVAGLVGVPSAFAGPSEIVVVADETTPPTYAAIDVIVQAEHGPDGLAWLITWSTEAADDIDAEIERLVAGAPRRADIEANFERGGHLALVDGPEAAMVVANVIAPEHLQLMNDDPAALVSQVRNAGAVFCGPLAPASIGDYVAGPSHVLPTFGSARFSSAAHRRRLPQARARGHRRARGLRPGGSPRRDPGPGRRLRRPRPVDRPATRGRWRSRPPGGWPTRGRRWRSGAEPLGRGEPDGRSRPPGGWPTRGRRWRSGAEPLGRGEPDGRSRPPGGWPTRGPSKLIKPRDDVALMEGYHSPQVEVAVRLNTNEAPEPPPAAWERAWLAALAQVDWHRYPDRSAAELRAAIAALHQVDPDPGLRGQRLQRGAADRAADLWRARANGGGVGADLCPAPPHRRGHRHGGGHRPAGP